MDSPKIACGEAAEEPVLSESTDQRILKVELGRKPLRRAKSKRAGPEAAQRRLDCCRAWMSQIESGEIDPWGMYWADEKLFRLGRGGGGRVGCVGRPGRVRGGIRIWRFGRRKICGGGRNFPRHGTTRCWCLERRVKRDGISRPNIHREWGAYVRALWCENQLTGVHRNFGGGRTCQTAFRCTAARRPVSFSRTARRRVHRMRLKIIRHRNPVNSGGKKNGRQMRQA